MCLSVCVCVCVSGWPAQNDSSAILYINTDTGRLSLCCTIYAHTLHCFCVCVCVCVQSVNTIIMHTGWPLPYLMVRTSAQVRNSEVQVNCTHTHTHTQHHTHSYTHTQAHTHTHRCCVYPALAKEVFSPTNHTHTHTHTRARARAHTGTVTCLGILSRF